MESDVVRTVAWDAHPETAKLKPWNSMFWRGCNAGILNYEYDWLDLVREGQVRIHIADVDQLSNFAVNLTDGTVTDDVDVIACATGFLRESSIKFLNCHVEIAQDAKDQGILEENADTQLLNMFPRLRD